MSPRRFALVALVPALLAGCYAVQASRDYYGLPTAGRNVAFVVDVSGSMEGRQEGSLGDQVRGEAATRAGRSVERTVGGAAGRVLGRQVRREATKLGGAKRELIPALRGLDPATRFGLITFGARVRPWRDALVEATGPNRDAAATHVNGLRADGQTPMREALERAFAFRGIDTIILVTDGMASDGSADAIRQRVRALNPDGRVTLHAVGLGGDQNEAFLDALARENGGRYVRRP